MGNDIQAHPVGKTFNVIPSRWFLLVPLSVCRSVLAAAAGTNPARECGIFPSHPYTPSTQKPQRKNCFPLRC